MMLGFTRLGEALREYEKTVMRLAEMAQTPSKEDEETAQPKGYSSSFSSLAKPA